MSYNKRLIERYVLRAISPYTLLALVLLTMILFVQQASRFAELLLVARVPLSLLAELAGALVPSVLAFTVPMATLAGTIIGFSRMNSDSELIAMRAAGVSNLKMFWSPLLLGLVLTAVALYINVEMAPEAARSLRHVGIRAALNKLDSPVEPRTFNTEIPGYVVYVRDGDKAQGRWERVFIYSKGKDGEVRLITARSGRIDASGDQSELVLNDAVATTLPPSFGRKPAEVQEQGQYVTEKLSQLRIVLETGRKALIERLQTNEPDPDEMTLGRLAAYAQTQSGAEGREAATLFHRRLALSFAPLLFAILGTTLSLHFGRGGRGWGSLLSLTTMIAYYMLALLGEQLARKGTVQPFVGVWLATSVAVLVCVLLLFSGPSLFLKLIRRTKTPVTSEPTRAEGSDESAKDGHVRLLGFPSLLDLSVVRSLAAHCSFAFVALLSVFLIFTLFELWRFISTARGGIALVVSYLLFLMPLATVQLLPASLLIAVLVTYALMSRRSEAIVWWASGQSVYRLMAPGLIFALGVGCVSWIIQEHLMPAANVRQDMLRAQIRGGVASATAGKGRRWIASATGTSGRIYSFEYEVESGGLGEPVIYEFDTEGVHLRRIVAGSRGTWPIEGELQITQAEVVTLQGSQINRAYAERADIEVSESPDLFKLRINVPSHLSSGELSSYIKGVKLSGRNVVPLQIALQRKYAEPPTAIIMALFGIPLALSFGRRSAVAALSSAVALGLAFWGVAGVFHQLGDYGHLPPPVAVWFPLVVFASLGVYLLTRMRT